MVIKKENIFFVTALRWFIEGNRNYFQYVNKETQSLLNFLFLLYGGTDGRLTLSESLNVPALFLQSFIQIRIEIEKLKAQKMADAIKK